MHPLLCKAASTVKGIFCQQSEKSWGEHFYLPLATLGEDTWPRELHLALPKAAQLPGCFVQPCWKTSLIK